ncbi:hypothetical protein FM037_03185 [Shewanella psychropiezotolerans]|uniref:Uncharacterized protein n=1 Tax=Shewanella psychropiezotolerans TaxID=2593655 RepID=A0ABX5WTU5_9GAMM|nr:hypothetical protein [Shewanella psychropiezotolerans]QDO82429.1 hypothetical protein FM037_03185 [Shewanella psychropiezotolerans]
MKVMISTLLSLFLLSFSAVADTTAFGLTLGKTTETELKKIYRAKLTGVNQLINGNIYSIPVNQLGIEGARNAFAIFDTDLTLSFIKIEFRQSRFEALNQILSRKYTLTEQRNIPFFGNKHAFYKHENAVIELVAPHLSDIAILSYITNEYVKEYQTIESEKRKRNKASELEKL